MANKNHMGVVAVVNDKPWTDRNTGENIVLYSFKLEGQNQWFRTGTTAPSFGLGESIKFVADGQNVDLATVEKVEGEPVRAPAPTASSTPSTSGSTSHRSGSRSTVSRDEYWANKEARDVEKEERFQNVDVPRMTRSTAMQAAAAVVDSALKTDALSYGNVAKSKRIPLLSGFVTQLAEEFYTYIMDGPAEKETASNDE